MPSTEEEKPKKKYLRNPEGEAQAQWKDSDLDFGGKKKQMIGSEGQVIQLDDDGQEQAAEQEKKSFKSTISGTEQKEGKWLMDMLSTEYTMFKFTIQFGKQKWEIAKRYSDFDKLDNRVQSQLVRTLPAGSVDWVVRTHA